jgi:hypothetical protein
MNNGRLDSVSGIGAHLARRFPYVNKRLAPLANLPADTVIAPSALYLRARAPGTIRSVFGSLP